ncbi:MAG: DNA-3-methyladenine glycosylase I [Bacteroidia bacterium]
MKQRCGWTGDDPAMILYHDKEWGVPVHDDRLLFEYMVLDAFQAGLSWRTVLHKRENFDRAFMHFVPEKVAQFTDKDIERLLQDVGIIRNKSKVHATVGNARAFLRVQEEYGGFDPYIWQFTGGGTIHNGWRTMAEAPASTQESDAMSKDLKRRGFKFVGTTICYAFMQAAGMVNDHVVDCFRYQEIKNSEQQ